MIVIMNMLYLLSHLMIGFIFTTIFITGYFGFLFLSLLLIIFGIITAFSVFYPDEYEYIIENYKILYDKNNMNHYQIVISPCKQYYTFRGIHYDIAFPLQNVLNETPNSGPQYCMNCKDYGTFRGVFIMYCANCAKYVYDYKFGYGAIQSGVEMGGDDVHKSAWNSYLKHRDPTKIGLPEELKNIDFNRPQHIYTVVGEKMICDNGEKYVRWYPDFVYEYDEGKYTYAESEDESEVILNESDILDNDHLKFIKTAYGIDLVESINGIKNVSNYEDEADDEYDDIDDNEFMQNMDERMGSMD